MKILVLITTLLVISNASSLCNTCIRLTEMVQSGLILITPTFVAKDVVKSVCEKQYQSQELCKKVSEELTPLAIRMGVRGIVKTGRICQQFCPKGFYSRLLLQKQIQSIIGNSNEAFSYITQLPYKSTKMVVNKGNTKLLHLTDIHLDLNYTANSSIACNFPICCHSEHGFPQSDANKAPEYGSSKCDTPMKLFESSLDFIKRQIPGVDAVLVTGDFSAHNQWEKTPQSVLNMRSLVEHKISQALNVELISAAGNNEYLPDHQVDPTTYPEESLQVTELVNENGKTATFISINTLYCDTINLYLIQDQTMPIRQLKTLNRILEEKDNVFLLAHISPTSPSCSEVYASLFRAILTKHSSKIKGQFYGHTHLDSFVVNTDPRNNQTATSFGMLAGSISPLGTNQPRLRVYELTGDFDLLNYNDYAFSMSSQSWSKNYNFKEYYGLPLDQPIDGRSMKELQEKLKTDANYRRKYSSKASASAGGSKYYCETYDSSSKVQECNGGDLSFKGKVQNILSMMQGPWGFYGNQVQ